MTVQEVLKQFRRSLDEDYIARPNGHTQPFLPASEMNTLGLTQDSPLTEFMDNLTWRTYGRGGNDPLTRKRLRDCDTEHLQNILITQRQIPLIMSRAIIAILQERYIQELIWSQDCLSPNHVEKGENPLTDRERIATMHPDINSLDAVLELRQTRHSGASKPKRWSRLRSRFWRMVNPL